MGKALTRLADFYKKGKGKKLVFAQQEPPVKFNAYKDNAGASPVMGLIEQIIEDAKKVESEATTSEYKAQADYESYVKDEMVAQLKKATKRSSGGQDQSICYSRVGARRSQRRP